MDEFCGSCFLVDGPKHASRGFGLVHSTTSVVLLGEVSYLTSLGCNGALSSHCYRTASCSEDWRRWRLALYAEHELDARGYI